MIAMFIRIESRLREFMLSVSLEVEDELVALVGDSAHGSSVVLRAIAGVFVPDSGLISVGERTLFSTGLNVNLPAPERRVGYIPQDHALFPHLTVAENIAYPIQRKPEWPDGRVNDRVADLLELLALDHVRERVPGNLSEDDRHRVALARALVDDPDVLLLDDPFSRISDDSRRRLREDFAALRRRLRVPTLLATSELDEAVEIADRLVLIERGAILQSGDVSTVLLQPKNLRVAEIVRSVNVIPGRVMRSSGATSDIDTPFGVLTVGGPSASDDAVDVVIRPERIVVRRPEDADPNAVNRIEGTVIGDVLHGATHTLAFVPSANRTGATRGDWFEPSEQAITLHIHLSVVAYQELRLDDSRECVIELDPDSLHVMPRFLERSA